MQIIKENRRKRFLLVGVVPKQNMPKEKIMTEMEELWSLVTTLGGVEIVDAMVQRAEHPDQSTYIGSGKVEELFEKVKTEQVDVVVLGNMAKPGQVHNIQKRLYEANEHIEVWDRIDLILAIFSRHAHTSEAKLQIELARMRHMGPRIYGMGEVLSNQAGGIGGVGIGETNTELMKRHWALQMDKVQADLAKLKKNREKQLERRKRVGLATVSIVGYTNAGKTALFNRLTKKHKLSENALFATLDSAIGKLFLPTSKKEVLVTDTIGFIKNLPPTLINAFTSTLMESIHADMLIHVIDISDPQMEEKIFTVEKILRGLNISKTHMVYVFNKMDQTKDLDTTEIAYSYQQYDPLFISVKEDRGIDEVEKAIDRYMSSL